MRREIADVLVIGSGPAGIAAAVAAAEPATRRRVIVVDEGLGPGGQIWRPGIHAARGALAQRWVERLGESGAAVHSATSVVDVRQASGGQFTVVAESPRGAVELGAAAIVVATGARERFLPFPGWTLTNAMGVGGAQALLKNGTSFRDKRVVIAGSGPLLLPVAAAMARHGARVVLVAEQSPGARVARYAAGLWRSPSKLLQAAMYRNAFLGTRYVTNTWVTAAHGSEKIAALDGVDRAGVASVDLITGANGRSTRAIACDVLCTAFGLVPNTEVARILGCRVAREGSERVVVVDRVQATTIPGVFCAGEPTGVGGVDLALAEGEIAGIAAAGLTPAGKLLARRDRLRRDARALARAFELRQELFSLAKAETVVCRCEDVRLGALDPAWSARQAKLYTRAGMGPCQGRICGAALECLMGPEWSADSIRPPIQPASLNTLLTYSDSPTPISSEQGAQ